MDVDYKALAAPFAFTDYEVAPKRELRDRSWLWFTYVQERVITARLTQGAQGWSFEVMSTPALLDERLLKTTKSGVLYDDAYFVVGRLHMPDGAFFDGVGQGTDPKAAATDALKRAARLAGIGRDLLGVDVQIKTASKYDQPHALSQFAAWYVRVHADDDELLETVPEVYRQGIQPRNPAKARQPAQGQQRKQKPAEPARVDVPDWTARALEWGVEQGVKAVRLTMVLSEPLGAVAKRAAQAGKAEAELTEWFGKLIEAVKANRPVGRAGRVFAQEDLRTLNDFAAQRWPYQDRWNMHSVATDEPPTMEQLTEAKDWNKRWFSALSDMGWRKEDWDAVHALFDMESFSGTDISAWDVWRACMARTPAFVDELERAQNVGPSKPSAASKRRLR